MFMRRLCNPLSRLRQAESGRRAFILANGPSILREDLSKLRGEVIIGMNASTMLEQQFGIVQTYYCLSDRRFINHEEKRRWATTELSSSTIRVVREDLRVSDDQALNRRTYYTPHIKRDGFSTDLGVGFFYGCTTTMLAVQLAFFLGCKEIFLLGVDLRYTKESPRFYKEKSPQMEDAFTSVQLWNIANAAKIMAKHGRSLINCSENSLLRPYLPYIPFEACVDGPRDDAEGGR